MRMMREGYGTNMDRRSAKEKLNPLGAVSWEVRSTFGPFRFMLGVVLTPTARCGV